MVCLDVPQHLNNRPEMTTTEMRAQFQQMLVLCGIPEDGREFLVNQGILSAAEFIKLTLDDGIKDLLKRLAATVHVAPEASFPPDLNDPAAVAAAATAAATDEEQRD